MTASATDVEGLVDELSLEEKCRMLSGMGAWEIPGCERLGIPDWAVSDGPVGVRGRTMEPALIFPGPSALGATFDPDLLREVGETLGREAVDRNIAVLLAPTINIHRLPRGGRHFESYSEDPELSARLAVAYIEGVQSQRVGACAKHFLVNDQEYERRTIDIEVDERTLREIYLPPFEAAVNEAQVRSVMGAYNYINGEHACSHSELLTGLLKEEWGFDGFVVSDWGAVKETVAPARNGLDLEMPGPGAYWGGTRLVDAVEAGAVPEQDIDDKVRRILSFLDWSGLLGKPTDREERGAETPQARAMARRAATSSMVLAKNERDLLPLDPQSTIALIGPGVAETALAGGGSASLTPYRTTNLLDALNARLPDATITHEPGLSLRRAAPDIPPEWIGPDGVKVELFAGPDVEGEPFETTTTEKVFNVWYAEIWPEGVEDLSIRISLELTPDRSGRYRLMGLGFANANARLFVDGDLVADKNVDGFAAALGQHAGVGYMELEAGRSYSLVLEHTPKQEGMRIAIVNIGIELDDVDVDGQVRAAVAAAGAADRAVVVVGSSAEWETEGHDRESLVLPAGQDRLVTEVLAANPDTIVVLNCGAPMELPWFDDAPAVLIAWYPGQEGGDALADVLLGEAEPGGRMPTTWALSEEDTPAFSTYPGEAGKLPYSEGIFVGYRWYDAQDIEPRIPFGHGLSYTTFEWGEPTLVGSGTDVTVEVAVTNTGVRPGSDVVQCYVAPLASPVPRPPKELAGFAKLHLEPGESGLAKISLNSRSFARWDTPAGDWVVDPGEYDLVLAASAADVRSTIRHSPGSS